MSEEELKEEENDGVEHELTAEVSEEKQQEVENTHETDQPEGKIKPTGTARTITASKILKANLAC